MILYLDYDKQKLPVRISYSVLKKIKRDTGKDFEDFQEEGDIEVYEPVLFYGLQSGHKGDKVEGEFPYKLEDMEDILDECFPEFIEMFSKFFPEEKFPRQTPTAAAGSRIERRKLTKGKK